MENGLFISHANPEDNEFALWLSLQLAREGYGTWCDVTQLLGGEKFWSEIEAAIRTGTRKFIYVLSRVSNRKEGALQELHLAKKVARNAGFQDFVIPVLIDDLPSSEFNIEIANINAISFSNGWAQGFAVLLEKLAKDGVPKNASFSPAAVASWWNQQYEQRLKVEDKSEEYLSNWLPLLNFPQEVYLHRFTSRESDYSAMFRDLGYPALVHKNYVMTFVPGNVVMESLQQHASLHDSLKLDVAQLKSGKYEKAYGLDQRKVQDCLVVLMRQAWEFHLTRNSFPFYEMADKSKVLFYTGKILSSRRRSIILNGYPRIARDLFGLSRKKRRGIEVPVQRHWHFGVQLKPFLFPQPGFYVKSHVIFSDDGINAWADKDRMHTARRSLCKSWWNDEWRDRLLLALDWLASQTDTLKLALAPEVFLEIPRLPEKIISPVSFADPIRRPNSEIDPELEAVSEIQAQLDSQVEEDEDEDEDDEADEDLKGVEK